MRGRKPKPVERQIAEGDPRRHGKNKLERRRAAEPKAAGGLPPCPRHLQGRSRAAWRFWAEELSAMQLDKRPDGPMLEGACRAYERAVKADLIVDKEGLIIQDKGFVVWKENNIEKRRMTVRTKKHPAVEISNRAWLLVRSFCSEFGLSPVSRTRLTIEERPDEEEAELMKALAQPRVKSPGSHLVQ